MSLEEADKIIAEFMGMYIVGEYIHEKDDRGEYCHHVVYSKSLDALVPVWEKLEEIGELDFERDSKKWYFGIDLPIGYEYGEHKSLQQAAAIATAKAIRSLK